MAPSSAQGKHQAGTAAVTDQPEVRRDILPVPDVDYVGLTTYDAKDPDTSYPPIRDVRPPQDAPNVLVVLIDDVGFGASSAFRRAVSDAEFREARLGRVEVHAIAHYGVMLADAAGSAHRAQPSLRGYGQHHRDRHRRKGLHVHGAEYESPLALTLKLNGYSTAQFGKCHERGTEARASVVSFMQVGSDAAYNGALGCTVRFDQTWCGFEVPRYLAARAIDKRGNQTVDVPPHG
jgi:Sulfatase